MPEGHLLDGRTAAIVGADVIGRGIAVRLARAGAALAVIDGDARLAEIAAHDSGGTAFTGAGREGLAPAIEAAAARLGGIDILVVNLLPPSMAAMLEAASADSFATAAAAVDATVAALQAAFPHIKRHGTGRIILVGHRYGESVHEGLAAYNAAAYAMVGLTRSAAMDWGRHGIATNLLLPAAMSPEYTAAHEKRTRIVDMMVGQLPLRRMGDPVEDIGGAALFLASDESAFVTGQIVHADGGQHIAGPVLSPIKFV